MIKPDILEQLKGIDLETLNSFSPEERAAVLSILQEFGANGTSNTFNDLLYEDYNEIPVDIITFVDDDRYLGNAWHDAEGKTKLYPYWRKELKKLFPDNITTSVNNAIFSGSRGRGKSEICVLIACYLLHRLLCLKNPLSYYHMKATEKIVFAFMNIKLAMAEEIGISKFQNTIQSSPWFMEHGEITGRTKKLWTPKQFNGQDVISIIMGSQDSDVRGKPIFYCLDGKTPILTDSGVFNIEDLVDKKIRVFNINDKNEISLSDECTVKPTATSREAYKITLEDGTVIECTPNHRFMLTDGSYKEAKDLTEEDNILEYKPVGYIYKVTNLTNGEFYIGQHKKSTFDKNYYGSGIRALNTYKKYGRKNLTIEVLDWAKTIDELNEKEEFYINKDFNNPKNINLSKTAVKGNERPKDWRLRKHLYTNGKDVRYFADEDNIPDGYKITNHNKNKTAITDGNITKYIDLDIESIPDGFTTGNSNTKGNHNMSNYYSNPDMQKRNSVSKSGKNNSMYGNGYRVKGEKNGHFGKPPYELAAKRAKEANVKYIYQLNDKSFLGMPDLQKYLKSLGYNISNCGINGLIKHNKRISKLYPELNITKELIKHENN